MKKRFATRYWAIAIWTVLVISLIPVLLIAQYNHGYADDYWYGEYTYHAW